MYNIGQTIKQLRKARGVTQEELANALNLTHQTVSKWENDTAQPDIMMMPSLADYFGVTIDDLFGYKLNVMTNKERLIRYMDKNGILVRDNVTLQHGGQSHYYINTENFSTNAQLSKIGEVLRTVSRKTVWRLMCWQGWHTMGSPLPWRRRRLCTQNTEKPAVTAMTGAWLTAVDVCCAGIHC